jgi:hypothetical protein
LKITIDALDGNGPIDYGAAIEAKHPIEIVRRLNEPSICTFGILCVGGATPPLPRNARVAVADDGGTLYFTGYLGAEPVLEYMGDGASGGALVALTSAISDEMLLDRQGLSRSYSGTGQTVSVLLNNLTRSASVAINSAGFAGGQVVGSFASRKGATWSTSAKALADSGRMSYRMLSGNLSVAPIGSTVHKVAEQDGSLSVSALSISKAKMLVNDVTLCGEVEPAAYVTEYFQGDGVTALFELSEKPFKPSGSATVLEDTFSGPAVNTDLWQLTDPGSNISQTSAGLTFCGGAGFEGDTYLASTDTLEIGGSLLLEAQGVVLGAGSDGMLLGLYNGTPTESNCFAGFRVKTVSGVTNVVPIIAGVEAGTSFAVSAGQLYALRLRIYCAEQERVLQTFYSVGDAGLEQFGGDSIPAGASLVLEVQESINGIPAPAVILYDGTVSNTPAVCRLAAASSTNLLGSMRSVTVERGLPAWVRVAPANGAWATSRIGTSALTGDCRVGAGGSLRFFTGNIPANGECIRVSYRTARRSIARVSNQQCITVESQSGVAGTSRWIGKLDRPAGRSSADCDNGALAMLNMSCSRTAAIEGRYVEQLQVCDMEAGDDVWPGDELSLDDGTGEMATPLVVREVRWQAWPVYPEVIQYTIDFANDWAQALSMSLSSTVPEDAWIPQTPNIAVLGNIGGVSAAISGNQIAVDAGVAPPAGGGFEVRRRDWSFGPGADGDLVLRSPVQHFNIPRLASGEQYYIRMYDASTPPVYSRLSSALFLNIPL